MPPRIPRKSYRPRASDRTMVDTFQPRSLSYFRIRKRRHENRMDLRRANTSEPLNMTWAGERSKHSCSFQSPGTFFPLTLPFIERLPDISNNVGPVKRFLSRLLHLLKRSFFFR